MHEEFGSFRVATWAVVILAVSICIGFGVLIACIRHEAQSTRRHMLGTLTVAVPLQNA